MNLTVYDLNAEQMQELKAAFFRQDETRPLLPEGITSPDQIPNSIIFEHYDGIIFTEDDFFCTVNGDFENCGAAYQGF